MKKFIALVALLALTVSTLGLTIIWGPNDPEEQIVSYRVYWAQGTQPFQFLADAGTNTSYTITNAVPGVYRFYITAVNFWTLESDPSNIVATPPPPTSPKMKMLYVIVGAKTNTIINLQ
jgi:fibronectin type 3 domain-containing protein